jgi:hypothetical protein
MKVPQLYFTTFPHDLHNSSTIRCHTEIMLEQDLLKLNNDLRRYHMFRFGFLFRFLLALVLIGVLVAGGMALYRTGWAQGYQNGAAAVGSGANTTPALPAPYYAYPPVPYGFGYGFHPFFFPFGPFLGIGFFLLILFMVGGLFRFGMRRHWAGGFGPGGWGMGHGPRSPQDWDEMRKEWEEFHKARSAKTQESGEIPPEK